MEVSNYSKTTSAEFLKDRELFYNQVLQSLGEYAVFTVDKDGCITSWNTGAFYLLGYTAEEILNRSGDILYTPEDIALHVPQKELETALMEGRAVNERYHVKKDRSLFWGSGLVFPLFDHNKEHQGFTKVMRNLTWVRDTEQENIEVNTFADKLVSASLEPLLVLNADFTIINYSEPFKEMFSLQDKQYRNQHIYEVLGSQADIKELRLLFEGLLSENDFYSGFEIILNTSDSKRKVIKADTRRFTINENGKQMIMQAFEDVTEKKALQEMKDLFIGIASHEIRNPLAVLKVYTQLLERELREYPKETVKLAVTKISEQGDKLMQLVSQLLDISKLENFEMQLKREDFSLYDLTLKVVEDFKLTNTSHDIFFDEIVERNVCADSMRMRQVLINLISNAIKYSPDADHIVINMRHDEQNNQVITAIHDFGIGIKSSEKDKLFRKFQRAENAIKRKISGAGLGLHISKEIIERHGGVLWFESTDGKGSCFYFSLPLSDSCS